jgi:AraC family transcriptional regulator
MSGTEQMAAAGVPIYEDRLLFNTETVRVGAFRCDRHHPDFDRASAPTKNFCFVFPRSAVIIEHEHERPFVANATVATFHNRAQEYRRRPVSDDGDRSDWFGINQIVLKEIMDSWAPGASPDPDRLFQRSHVRLDASTYFLQRRVFEQAIRASEVEPLAIEEMVLIILERLVRALAPRHLRDDPGASRRHVELAREAEILLSRRFDEARSLAAIAHYLHTSEYHLCRVFRRVTGETLHQYRHDLRVRTSLERIADSPSTLTDVAIELGFSSHSHFTQAFHHEFGERPSRFRRIIRKDPLNGLSTR